MKLTDLLESLPVVFDTKSVNSLNKKPKKLKKGVYGNGGGPVGLNISHAASCPASSGGTETCTCAGADGGSGGAAGGGAGGGGGS